MRDLYRMNPNKIMNRAGKNAEVSKKANPLQQSSYLQLKEVRKVFKDDFQTD